MKIILTMICLGMLSGCATGRLLQTEEGRKFLINSPEIKQVLRSETMLERIEKWCAIDPMFRMAVRLELIGQKTYLPILSDEDSCENVPKK